MSPSTIYPDNLLSNYTKSQLVNSGSRTGQHPHFFHATKFYSLGYKITQCKQWHSYTKENICNTLLFLFPYSFEPFNKYLVPVSDTLEQLFPLKSLIPIIGRLMAELFTLAL